jgi:hypothetical protein
MCGGELRASQPATIHWAFVRGGMYVLDDDGGAIDAVDAVYLAQGHSTSVSMSCENSCPGVVEALSDELYNCLVDALRRASGRPPLAIVDPVTP